MKFESKFDIGQEVYAIHDNCIVMYKIYSIKTEQACHGGVLESYKLDKEGRNTFGDTHKFVDSLFATKEEAGKEWLKAQGLDCGMTAT